ncbi:hypothetical protein VPHK165_0071 [Vibrio phage K165]|nr:hypothetical protein MYOV022v2_p0055 [Vibrio phage 12E28.1]QZI90224.1 hypothetical protein MYOV021v2_p0055 [Vibrio phage 18E29.1]QZI90589.1 hypothetical protein MYOV023v1_p0042 [Vibrio phage 91E28.1a]QZI90661.1 hypothetical protein MYOV020v1_p0035 [Vibrio phage 98E28.6a]
MIKVEIHNQEEGYKIVEVEADTGMEAMKKAEAQNFGFISIRLAG